MNEKLDVLNKLAMIIKSNKNKKFEDSYTARLFDKGKEKIANKFGEESFELTTAFLSQTKKDLTEETADLIYHLLVLLEYSDIKLDQVLEILEDRMKKN